MYTQEPRHSPLPPDIWVTGLPGSILEPTPHSRFHRRHPGRRAGRAAASFPGILCKHGVDFETVPKALLLHIFNYAYLYIGKHMHIHNYIFLSMYIHTYMGTYWGSRIFKAIRNQPQKHLQECGGHTWLKSLDTH